MTPLDVYRHLDEFGCETDGLVLLIYDHLLLIKRQPESESLRALFYDLKAFAEDLIQRGKHNAAP